MDMRVLAARPTWQGLSEGKPCCLEFQDLLQSLCLWAARGRMLFGFRASSGVSMFNPFCFNGDDPFPRSIFIDLGRSQQQGKNNDLNETEDSAVLTVEGRSPRALAREDRGLGVPAALMLRPDWLRRASSGWCRGKRRRGARRGGGGQAPWPGPVTESTPGTSPGCRRDGCCCWSRCRSSGGWSSWLPPAASSACSSEKGREHEWLSGQSAARPPALASCKLTPAPPDSPGDCSPHGLWARLPGFKSRLHHLLAA